MILARLFPGDRRVWGGAALILIPALALIAYQLLLPRPFYTATDSVGASAPLLTIDKGQPLCITNVPLAGGTGAVQVYASTTGPSQMSVEVKRGHTVVARGVTDHVGPPPANTAIPLDHVLAPGSPLGEICLEVTRGSPVNLAGFLGTFTHQRTTLGTKVEGLSISLWLAPPAGVKRSLLASWATAMHRLTLFKPGFAGDVFFWLVFLLGLPGIAYWAIRLLACAGRLSTRRLAFGLMLVAFTGSAIWAVSTAPFDAPDEPEHFAYVEHLAETGHAPLSVPSALTPYPSDEAVALNAVHQFAVAQNAGARRPWFGDQAAQYRRTLAQTHPSRTDGGGEAAATAPHSPLYYALLIPGYEIGRSGSTFDELFWMRLSSALLASLAVLGAFLTIRELAPRRPELAVAGGLLLGTEPMFSFVSGAVNNDNGVNALAAITVWLAIRLLRRGPDARTALAFGIVLGLLPLMKATGYALFPAAAVAGLVLLWRHRNRQGLIAAGLSLLGFLVITGIWGLLAGHFGRSVLTVPGGTSATVSSATGGAGSGGGGLFAHFVYAVELFVPHLPGFARHWASGYWPFDFVYIKRGFASFGWYADFFPQWVYSVVLAGVLASGAGAVVMAVRRRSDLRRLVPEAAVLMLVILGVLLVVEFAYYSPVPRPQFLDPEQGRYAFPAGAALAGLAVCWLLGIKRERSFWILGGLVMAMVALATGSHLLYLVDAYT